MTDITNRAYTGADDLHAIQAAHTQWMAAGADSHVHVGDIAHRLHSGMRGKYPLGEVVRIWEQDSALVAFALIYPRWEGYDAILDPRYLGTRLEDEVEQWCYRQSILWMDREGQTDKSPGVDVPDGDSRRRAWLEARGYKNGGQTMTINRRSLVDIPAPNLPEGYTIRPIKGESEIEQIIAVHVGSFGSDWTAELYIDEVMRKPGYDAERELVVVAPDGCFAAFTLYWLDAVNKIGLFEPVGTHAEFQRKGLGRALLYHTMHLMRDQGMTQAQVGNDVDNPPAASLYAAVGFEPTFPILDYRKERKA